MLGPEILSEVTTACQDNAAKIAQALGHALGAALEATPGTSGTYDVANSPASFDGPGLVVLFAFESTGMVAVLPESTRFLPAWCATPDATGESRLKKLAQE